MVPRRLGLAALIFDMDGTLIESSTVIPDAYIACIRALGGPHYTSEQIVDAYSVGPPEAMLTHLLGRRSLEAEVDDYHDRLARTARRATVYPGIRETLAALEGRVPLAVFTGASTRACRILLEAAGLSARFDVFVGADEVTRSKPHPDGILLACERLGVEARYVAYVGDAPGDLEAARRCEACAVAASWGHLYRPEEASDVVLAAPQELLELVG